jgi:hypothetical protein
MLLQSNNLVSGFIPLCEFLNILQKFEFPIHVKSVSPELLHLMFDVNVFKCLEFKLMEKQGPFLCYIVFCCIGIHISGSTQQASCKLSAKFITAQLTLNLKVMGPDS